MPHVALKDYLHHLTKHEDRGTSKIPVFKPFSELENVWKCSLGFSKIHIRSPRPAFQNPHFESMDELGKFMS